MFGLGWVGLGWIGLRCVVGLDEGYNELMNGLSNELKESRKVKGYWVGCERRGLSCSRSFVELCSI